jgi:hypothetical protein
MAAILEFRRGALPEQLGALEYDFQWDRHRRSRRSGSLATMKLRRRGAE